MVETIKWRKITIADYATIIGYSSSTPTKINYLLKKANAMLLYVLISLFYIRNLSSQILKQECLNDFFLTRKKQMIINVVMFDLVNSKNTHSINDSLDDDWQELFEQD